MGLLPSLDIHLTGFARMFEIVTSLGDNRQQESCKMSTELESPSFGVLRRDPTSLASLACDMEKIALTATALLAARKQVDIAPTDKQKESGNYQKGHITWQGLPITIENPKGSTRSGKSKDGKAWSIKMKNDYGYFNRTEGKDGDQLDLFIGPVLDSELVFVVNQVNPSSNRFDEHKCVIGCISEAQARSTYLDNYETGWQGLGSIKAMSLPDFKKWVLKGDLSKQAEFEKIGAGPIEKPRVRFVLPYQGKYLLQEAVNPEFKGYVRHAGGGIEENETPEQAALREFKEEFGAELAAERLKYLGVDPRPEFSSHHFYEIPDHGLAPGSFQASNDPNEVVNLVAGLQSGDKYLGPGMSQFGL